ncbi:MAG: hypothetical protein HY093_02975 [Candidatus Liptonbacteria bacterium]|nr:hypothetical protein [Candidatus Liptonbacteria bacterium]
MNLQARKGFIALTSAVVVSVLLLTVTLSLGLTGFFARFNTLEVEYKERSLALAEACATTALLKLATNRGYLGNETISVENLACAILPVSTSGGQVTIKTRAEFPQSGLERAVTNLVIMAGNVNLNVISWEEVPNQT